MKKYISVWKIEMHKKSSCQRLSCLGYSGNVYNEEII